MAKKLLIDATHPEEVRVALVDGPRLQDYEAETLTKKQFKGNIYLAKVIRIEPSLQAAFVEFGNNRHGFLPFAEIHPDYYRIPVSDRQNPTIDVAVAAAPPTVEGTEGLLTENDAPSNGGELPVDDGLEMVEEDAIIRRPKHYHYKIQEVIKRRQIMLIQVVKEERGNKGAALTTYLSLPGRYCVLMPNAGHRSGGISRKISEPDDRKRLKEVLKDLPIPEGMSLIVRTAGEDRNKLEIRRDFEYLLRLWSDIRDSTLKGIAPELIYAEGDLIKRTIRDSYSKDVEEILVEGDEGYKAAKNFMKTLIPSHTKKVKLYKDDTIPLFYRHQVETQIDAIMTPTTTLPSGGTLVINPTEALVAIDVNSGKSTRERHIDDTALKTNLEAADEVARQMRLRDLGGLIVIDFIDMNDSKHIQAVEKRIKEAVKSDRARVQIGRISQFGLLELSRQRLRPSIIETNTKPCTHCHGTGSVRSIESMGLLIMRAIEVEGISGLSAEMMATVPPGVDLYLLNQKRSHLIALEQRYAMSVIIQRDETMIAPDFRIDRLLEQTTPRPVAVIAPIVDVEEEADMPDELEEEAVEAATTSPRHRRGQSRHHHEKTEKAPEAETAETPGTEKGEQPTQNKNRKRRGLFNKRRQKRDEGGQATEDVKLTDQPTIANEGSGQGQPTAISESAATDAPPAEGAEQSRSRNRNRNRRNNFQRRRQRREAGVAGGEDNTQLPQEGGADTRSKTAETPKVEAQSSDAAGGDDQPKKRRGWWKRLLDA